MQTIATTWSTGGERDTHPEEQGYPSTHQSPDTLFTGVSSVGDLRARIDSLRTSIGKAHSHSEALAEHVAEMTQLVDDAASRHAEWETKLASMVESDTRRSAEVAQKQESLAVALGIRPLGASSPVWRVIQHVVFLIGLALSLILVSPLSALKRWNDKRGVTQGSRLTTARPGRHTQLPAEEAFTTGVNVGVLQVEGLKGDCNDSKKQASSARIASAKALGTAPQLREASVSGLKNEFLSKRTGKSINMASSVDEVFDVSSTNVAAKSSIRMVPNYEKHVVTIQANVSTDDSSAGAEKAKSGLVRIPKRRLSWADRSHLLGENVERKSEDGAETDFWNTFDT